MTIDELERLLAEYRDCAEYIDDAAKRGRKWEIEDEVMDALPELLRERRELLARVAELESEIEAPLPSRTMTVQELLDALKGFSGETTVAFDTGERPDSLESWRGSYDELALGHDCDGRTTSVYELCAWLAGAIGKVFVGYKGGNYLMRPDTYVWCDNYGEYTSRMIVGVRERDGNAVLVTRVED